MSRTLGSMSRRAAPRNVRPILWLSLSVLGFVAALALRSSVLAVFASVAILGALLSVGRFPRIRD
jgi:hypothetical protein